MKALQFDRSGSLDALTLREVDMPTPAAGEVLVKVEAAGINPSDIKNVLGRFPYTTVPRIPGRDFAGVVVDGPAEWLNKSVWGSGKGVGFTRDGSHAEYLSLPVEGLSLKPASLSFAQAASCGVPYLTALEALDRSHITHNSSLLIIGGGAVAQAALAIAHSREANILMALRNDKQQATLSASGLHTLLLDSETKLVNDVQQHFPAGAEVIFDTTGAWLGASVQALANRGHLAIIATPSAQPLLFPALDFYRRSATLVGVNSLLHDLAASAHMLDDLAKQFDNQQLAPPTGLRECPLSEAVAIYHDIHNGDSRKTVFTF